jgi:hypothetical protein
MQPTQDLAVIRARPCPRDLSCFLINGVRHDRNCVLIDGDLSFSDVGVKLTFARSTQTHR